jgi:hypothetical protein
LRARAVSAGYRKLGRWEWRGSGKWDGHLLAGRKLEMEPACLAGGESYGRAARKLRAHPKEAKTVVD